MKNLMSIGVLDHSGFVSYQKYDDTLLEYYTTTEADETISFLEGTTQRYFNSLLLESIDSDLYIRLLPFDYVIFIPSGESRNCDYIRLSSIQVMGLSGQKLRWSGFFY